MPDATRPLFSLLGFIVATSHGVVATSGRMALRTWRCRHMGNRRENHVAASREGWYQQTTRIRHAIPTAPDRNWIGTQRTRPPQKLKKMAGGLP